MGSLAVQSLLLESEDRTGTQPDPKLAELVSKLLRFGAQQLDRNYLHQPKTERKRRTLRKLEKSTEWLVQQNDVLLGPEEFEELTPAEFAKRYGRHWPNDPDQVRLLDYKALDAKRPRSR